MTGKQRSTGKPGFTASLVFAALAAGLALWWASTGDLVPAIGFGAISVVWVIMAIRTRPKPRARDTSAAARAAGE
jgi:hypothetical protein